MTRRITWSASALFLAFSLTACGDDPQPADIQFSVNALNFDAVGDTATVEATVFDEEGVEMPDRTVEWTTDNAGVAAVSADGRVSSVGTGSTNIVATVGSAVGTVPVSVVPTVSELTRISPVSQSGIAGEPLDPMVVEARDRLGNPAEGVLLSVGVDAGGGTLSASSVATGADGRASVVWTLGPVAGELQQIRFFTTEGPTTAAFFLAETEAGPVAEILAEGGDEQVGLVSSTLPTEILFRVADRLGNPKRDEAITASVVSGGGSVNPTTATSDTLGGATVTWTLGPDAGEQRIRVAVGSVERDFTATALSEPAGLQVVQGASVMGTVDEPVADDLVVRLEDGGGAGIPGVPLRFAVDEGNGTIAASAGGDEVLELLVETDTNGEATLGQWRLGQAAGSQTLTASFPGLTPVTLSADAAPGAASEVSVSSGDLQTAEILAPLVEDVFILAEDVFGNAVPNATVSFSVVSGDGSLSDASGTTGPDGTVGFQWTLGPLVGLQQVEAAVAGGGTVLASSAGLLPSPNVFNIDVDFLVPVEPYIWAAFQVSANRWARVIVEDVPDQNADIDENSCGAPAPAVRGIVDDLRIFIRVEPIDGPGGTLGSAGPCWIRTTNPSGGPYDLIPFLGRMRLDVEDLETQDARGTLVDLLTHEIGHIIGIGTLWDDKGFLQNPSLAQGVGVDTHFNGPAAIREFDFIGGDTYTGGKVPVENTQGGAGTRDSHWRESFFTEELMTGFIDRFNNPLSRVTIGSLEDLGYVVDLEGGDDFNLAPAALRGPEGGRIHLVNDILWLPLRRAPITNPVSRR